MDFTGILLAGGKSTRFGINKIKLEFEGIPLLADQIIKMGFFCTEILISSSSKNFRYISQVIKKLGSYKKTLLTSGSVKTKSTSRSDNNTSYGLPEPEWKNPITKIIIDDEETRLDGNSVGPLAGIYSGLKEAKNKNCLVLASDMPFVSYRVLRLLTRTSEETKKCAVIIKNPKGIEALCGIYSKQYIKQMRDNIRNGVYKISEVLGDPEVEWIRSRELKGEKIDIYNFFNINTAGDIENFERIRNKGIAGVDLDRLKGGSRNLWEAFFYRGTDRKF